MECAARMAMGVVFADRKVCCWKGIARSLWGRSWRRRGEMEVVALDAMVDYYDGEEWCGGWKMRWWMSEVEIFGELCRRFGIESSRNYLGRDVIIVVGSSERLVAEAVGPAGCIVAAHSSSHSRSFHWPYKIDTNIFCLFFVEIYEKRDFFPLCLMPKSWW